MQEQKGLGHMEWNEYLIWPDRDKGDICHCNSRDGKSRDGGEKEGEVRNRFMTHSKQGGQASKRGERENDRETRVSGVPQHV